MNDVAMRLANRVLVTSDGHKAYLEAVEGAFGADIDYAMLIKLYGASSDSAKRPVSSRSFDTVLIDTSARRETERIEAPSQSMARIWARLAISSLFMPELI